MYIYILGIREANGFDGRDWHWKHNNNNITVLILHGVVTISTTTYTTTVNDILALTCLYNGRSIEMILSLAHQHTHAKHSLRSCYIGFVDWRERAERGTTLLPMTGVVSRLSRYKCLREYNETLSRCVGVIACRRFTHTTALDR